MTRRSSRRRETRDWWVAGLLVGLIVLLVFAAEVQLGYAVQGGGSTSQQLFGNVVLRGLLLVAAGMGLAAVLPEPEREYKATRRIGFWLAAGVPLLWLLVQWLSLMVGVLPVSQILGSGVSSGGWFFNTPIPAFWLGVAAGTALRQTLGRR